MGAATRLLVLGLVFHAVYIASIFDIYFVSPVVHVDRRFGPLDQLHERPPADRVVLIVGARVSIF
jgi:phosphatidylinositol glycan class N